MNPPLLSSYTVETESSQAATTPDLALKRLMEGNERFVNGKSRSRDWAAQVKATAEGQYPFAAIVSCLDSRVPVEVVFDQGLGSVFNARVAGNIVNDDILGSLEYATHVVGAKLIVVLG